MTTKGEKISQTKSEKGKEKILKYIKSKKRFNDYIITEYLGYNGSKLYHPDKSMKHLGHQIKIKCLKCGYESITSSYIFLIKQNQEKMYKCSVDENHRRIIPELNLKENNYQSFYKKKYASMWMNMNANCNPNFNNNPKCKYIEKGIKVYKDWLFYESSYHHCKNINAKNYINYENYIDLLLESHGFSLEDIKNKSIRIERVDKHGDFIPENLGIRIFKMKKLLTMERKNAKY